MIGKSQDGLVSFFNSSPVNKGGTIQQLLKQLRFPGSKISGMLQLQNHYFSYRAGHFGKADVRLVIKPSHAVYPGIHVIAVAFEKAESLRENSMKRIPINNSPGINSYDHSSFINSPSPGLRCEP